MASTRVYSTFQANVDHASNHYVDPVTSRAYGQFRKGQYLLPVDGVEQERLDIMHTLVQAARPKDKRLHHAPFRERADPETGEQPRVLDLGCGTGIWLLDMAEKYGNTSFTGVDMYNMAPSELYHNVEVRTPVDYEAPWALGETSFDLIHLQMGLGSVANWPALYAKVFRHLKPGGWFEHVELDWQPRCDDGTLRKGKYTDWWETYVMPPYGVVGRPIAYNPDTGHMLHEQGFTGIEHATYRVPTNGWPAVPRSEHVAGMWWETAMASGQGHGHGFEALSLAVLTRVQGWEGSHARRLCEDAFLEASNPNVHSYNLLHVWWAQKPSHCPR